MDKRLFTDMTDREIMIQQAGVLNKLCGSLKDLKKSLEGLSYSNGKEHGKLFDKIENVAEKKVANPLFMKVTTIIFVCILGIISFVGALNTDVVKNSGKIESIEHLYEIQYEVKK